MGNQQYTPDGFNHAQPAGYFFLLALWIQSQLVDLIILEADANTRRAFLKNPAKIPRMMVQNRIQYWESTFGQIRGEFEQVFSQDLSANDRDYLTQVECLRNAIAHAHVSAKREYLLYRPPAKREQNVIRDLKLQPVANQANPMMVKVIIGEDHIDLIRRLNEDCLGPIAQRLGIPHGQIQ